MRKASRKLAFSLLMILIVSVLTSTLSSVTQASIPPPSSKPSSSPGSFFTIWLDPNGYYYSEYSDQTVAYSDSRFVPVIQSSLDYASSVGAIFRANLNVTIKASANIYVVDYYIRVSSYLNVLGEGNGTHLQAIPNATFQAIFLVCGNYTNFAHMWLDGNPVNRFAQQGEGEVQGIICGVQDSWYTDVEDCHFTTFLNGIDQAWEHYYYVHNCGFVDCADGAVWVDWKSSYITIDSCTAIRTAGSAQGNGFVLCDTSNSLNNYFACVNCYTYNVFEGVATFVCDKYLIQNNTIVNSAGQEGIHTDDSGEGNSIITNNTVVNNINNGCIGIWNGRNVTVCYNTLVSPYGKYADISHSYSNCYLFSNNYVNGVNQTNSYPLWYNESLPTPYTQLPYYHPSSFQDIPNTFNLVAGWNLVSPVVTQNYPHFSVIFDGVANYQVVTWNDTSYVPASIAEPNKAYWVFVPSNTTISFVGRPLNTYAVHLTPGWHMISGLYGKNVLASDICSGFHQVSTWTGTNYVTAPIMNASKGYWVFVLNSTDLIMA